MVSFQLRESIVVFSEVVKKYNKINRERGKEHKLVMQQAIIV